MGKIAVGSPKPPQMVSSRTPRLLGSTPVARDQWWGGELLQGLQPPKTSKLRLGLDSLQAGMPYVLVRW